MLACSFVTQRKNRNFILQLFLFNKQKRTGGRLTKIHLIKIVFFHLIEGFNNESFIFYHLIELFHMFSVDQVKMSSEIRSSDHSPRKVENNFNCFLMFLEVLRFNSWEQQLRTFKMYNKISKWLKCDIKWLINFVKAFIICTHIIK